MCSQTLFRTSFARPRCTQIIHKAIPLVRAQFRLSFQHGVHGLPHWTRVWYHGWSLASSLDVDPAILAWFAFLHDSQRHNDHKDPLHGVRAADFALQLRATGVICELNDSDFERLCEAMRLHSDGHTEGDAAIQACWDADRLDLWRVGIKPDPRYLCTPHARKPTTLRRANKMAEGIRRKR